MKKELTQDWKDLRHILNTVNAIVIPGHLYQGCNLCNHKTVFSYDQYSVEELCGRTDPICTKILSCSFAQNKDVRIKSANTAIAYLFLR